MSIRKKIVFLPYDMDTALGINNEGELVFSYNLEDIDHLQSGANVFNGQDSVLWKNLRAAFSDDIRTMYQDLRSSGGLSYDIVEEAFENHQNKWGEAIFNEDAWFKYLAPLIEDNNGAYLSMLQGSKAEQRKWWLFNRFRYIDSKYNAGDALTDYITVRGYAPADITVTPYADIYAAVKFGSTLVQGRAPRDIPYTLECPLDNVNDTETMIFSASQLKSIGDLAPYKIGFGDFRNGTKLQSIKVGDASSQYSNGNLTSLMIGNNTLLKTLDVRNCPSLTGGVDISHCTNIEHVYFDGTAISGITLPNGGFLKTLHLPDTVTNLTILNQRQITDFKLDDYSNISTLRLENVSGVVDSKEILSEIAPGSRVRLMGFAWQCDNYSEASALYDILDTMRGLDENNETMQHVQIEGSVHIPSLSEGQYIQLASRYSTSINVTYDRLVEERYDITWLNSDGSVLGYSRQLKYGAIPQYSGAAPTNPDAGSGDQTFRRWKPDIVPVTGNATYIASFTPYYTVTFKDGNTTLQTITGVDRGASAIYTGEIPTKNDYEFTGWSPQPINIQGDTTCSAQFIYSNVPETITDSWEEIIANIENGTYLTKYSIGDTKKLLIYGKTYISMRLVGLEADELEEGGFAPTTWLATTTATGLYTSYNGANNNGQEGTGINGGWAASTLRRYVQNTVKPLLPYNVRENLKRVKKYSKGHNMQTQRMDNNMLSIDDLWIPSYREMHFTGAETMGPMYLDAKPKHPDDVATPSGTRQQWLGTRSGSADIGVHMVYALQFSSDGATATADNQHYPYVYNYPILLGFCI